MTAYEEQAKKAIGKVFSDTSVSPEETKSIRNGLIEEIEMLIDTIED